VIFPRTRASQLCRAFLGGPVWAVGRWQPTTPWAGAVADSVQRVFPPREKTLWPVVNCGYLGPVLLGEVRPVREGTLRYSTTLIHTGSGVGQFRTFAKQEADGFLWTTVLFSYSLSPL
jgi:hypothetical protein